MLIPAAILSVLVYGVISAMLGTVMPGFTALFHLSGKQNGNIALAQALGLVIASLAAGPFIDRRGKKTPLLGGLVLITLALSGLPGSGGYTQLLFLYFVLGLGGGFVVTAANALATGVGEDRRASTLNFVNLFFGLGGLLTGLLAADVFEGDSAKLCYTGAGLGLVALGANLIAKIPPPTGVVRFRVSEVGGVLKQPVLYLFALFVFLYVACEVGVWNWLASYLISRHFERAKALNILSLGFALGLLIGRLAVTPILTKISSIAVLRTAAVLMAATTYAMLQFTDARSAWLAVFFAGLAMAPVYPTTLAMVANAFPRGTATAMGIVITSGWIGLAVSSPIIGAVSGDNNAHLGTALLLLPVFSVAMLPVSLALKPAVDYRYP